MRREEEIAELAALRNERDQEAALACDLKSAVDTLTAQRDQLRTRVGELEARRDELLALVAKVAQETPLADEVADALNQRGVLLAAIGTLRNELRDKAQTVAVLRAELARLKLDHQIEAAQREMETPKTWAPLEPTLQAAAKAGEDRLVPLVRELVDYAIDAAATMYTTPCRHPEFCLCVARERVGDVIARARKAAGP